LGGLASTEKLKSSPHGSASGCTVHGAIQQPCEQPTSDRKTVHFNRITDILIVEIDPEVPPGILTSLLDREGRRYEIARAHAGKRLGDAIGPGAVVVLGGAMSTSEVDRFPFLNEVKRFMETVLGAGLPLLGICLGGQLLAEILGGKVVEKSFGERGLHEIHLTDEGRKDPMFFQMPEEFTVFQWHNDSFIPPSGTAFLARSALCPHQAFRYGKHAYGIQFHPEVDESIIEVWSADDPAAATVSQAFRKHCLAGHDRTSSRILMNFIRMARTKG
jgi:GMP synthase (glutamine-hydrolysing)